MKLNKIWLRLCRASILGLNYFRVLVFTLFLLGTISGKSAAEPFSELKNCRPQEEEGEFLQTCIKANIGKRKGKILGPGIYAPGKSAAAVVWHKQYESIKDRVKVKIYDSTGMLEASYPMGVTGDEYLIQWSKVTDRFLGWVEVDGRGGVVKVIDRQKKKIILTGSSPLEEWDIFSPQGLYIMIPIGRAKDDPLAERVLKVEIINLLSKEKKTILSVEPDEELTNIKWAGPNRLSATVNKVNGKSKKIIQGAF